MSAPVLALVAVRLKSSRCPMKGLADLAGKPLILRLHERVAQAETPDRIVWCTSTHPQDDPLEVLAKENGIEIFRGDKMDVLSRFIAVAQRHDAGSIIRVTGDNPLSDPVVLDDMVREHIAQDAEYTYVSEQDMPRGTRVEVMSVSALKRCHELAQDPAFSEYMTLMFRRPDHFRVLKLEPCDKAIRRGDVRLTVDTPEDLQAVRALYEAYDGQPPALKSVISWVDAHREIKVFKQVVRPRGMSDDINVRLKGDGMILKK